MVAHTADDQAETLLLNLMRGSGLQGLAGMRVAGGGPRAVNRPLLGLRRADTEAVVEALGWEFVHDESNEDMRFRRNRVRRELVPLLASISGRDPVPVLARTASLLGGDAEYLDGLAAVIDATDVAALRAAPRPLATRALRSWLRQGAGAEQHPGSSAEMVRVWAVVDGAVKACELAGGRRLRRSGGKLYVGPAPAPPV